MRLFTDRFHFHRWTTLIVFHPDTQLLRPRPLCATYNDKYGFLLHCECGATKHTKLPYTITEIFNIGDPK
jgi:hypothetical protein